MSTLHASPDLLTLRSFLRARVKLYIVLTLVAAVLIGLATRPKVYSSAPSARAFYVSYASLLLPANTRFAMKSIFVSTGQSDLDFWLSDETLFRKFLERQKVYEKVEAKLRPKHPELALLSRSVTIMALQLGSSSGGNPGANSPGGANGPGSGLADLFARQSNARESDYAQLEQNDDSGLLNRNQHRVNRIVIQAVAQAPKDSEVLAGVVVTVLQKELEDVATRRARSQRRVMENYIRVGSRNVARAQKALQLAAASEPEKALQKRRQTERAQNRCQSLNREIADLTRQLELKRNDSVFRAATQANPAQDAVEALQQQLRLAEQTYLPASSTLMLLRARLPNLQQLAQRIDAENAQKETASLQASLLAKQKLLQQVQTEIQQASSGQPSDRSQQQFKVRERELATWEAELLSWEQKLLQVRIEERLCKGDGTAVLLQAPRLGTRSYAAAQEFLSVYHKTLTMLPLAPLAALVCLLLIHFLQENRQIRSRAEYFLDAPVLGELPSLKQAYRKTWQELKFRGRSG